MPAHIEKWWVTRGTGYLADVCHSAGHGMLGSFIDYASPLWPGERTLSDTDLPPRSDNPVGVGRSDADLEPPVVGELLPSGCV